MSSDALPVSVARTARLREALPMMTKIIALIGAALVAFALFALTFSAIVAEDGALRATAFGVIFGLTGFGLTFVTVHAILDTGK